MVLVEITSGAGFAALLLPAKLRRRRSAPLRQDRQAHLDPLLTEAIDIHGKKNSPRNRPRGSDTYCNGGQPGESACSLSSLEEHRAWPKDERERSSIRVRRVIARRSADRVAAGARTSAQSAWMFNIRREMAALDDVCHARPQRKMMLRSPRRRGGLANALATKYRASAGSTAS